MNIAWFIFTTFVVIGIQSFVFGKWGLRKVEYNRSFSERAVFEGEVVEMIDEVSNPKLLPVPWLRLESKIDPSLQFHQSAAIDNEINSNAFHRTLFSLMPYQKVTRRQKLTCTKRGFYQFQTVSLSTGDIFGIDKTFTSVNSTAEIIVYPPLIKQEDLPLPAHSWLGEVIAKRWIIDDPFLTAGVRDYASGDPLNSINWKSTARTNRLQVTKKDFSADHHIMIYLNFNQTEDIWRPIVDEASMEETISYAASITQYAIFKGIHIGFGCNSYIDKDDKQAISIDPANGKQQLTYLLETMAKLKIGTSTYFDYFLQAEVDKHIEGMDILIISNIMTEKMEELCKKLEANGNSVEVHSLHQDVLYKRAG